jgi:hypothetical protein
MDFALSSDKISSKVAAIRYQMKYGRSENSQFGFGAKAYQPEPCYLSDRKPSVFFIEQFTNRNDGGFFYCSGNKFGAFWLIFRGSDFSRNVGINCDFAADESTKRELCG